MRTIIGQSVHVYTINNKPLQNTVICVHSLSLPAVEVVDLRHVAKQDVSLAMQEWGQES